MAADEAAQKNVKMAQELVGALLESFTNLLKDGSATATDRATIARFLKDNNYSVDPRTVPQSLVDIVNRTVGRRDLPNPELTDSHGVD